MIKLPTWSALSVPSLAVAALVEMVVAVYARATTRDGGSGAIRAIRHSANGARMMATRVVGFASSVNAIGQFRGTAIARCITHGGGDGVIHCGGVDASRNLLFARATVTCVRGLPTTLTPTKTACLTTAWSWSNISVGYSFRARRYITRMASGTTTGSRTWNCGRGGIPLAFDQMSRSTARHAHVARAIEFLRAS
jgi:hypothetical protein